MIFRFNIPESEAKAKPFNCGAFGCYSIFVVAIVRKMVGGANIVSDICIFTIFVCDTNVKLDHLQLQCKSKPLSS